MSILELLIGVVIGMVMAYYSHDKWCDWIKYRKEKMEAKENVRKL